MSDISEDIWFEILKVLPVKTLGKCRCVCKPWRSLIVSPYFMAAHLKNYTQSESNSLLIYREMPRIIPTYEQYVLFRDSTDVNEENNIFQEYDTLVCPFLVDIKRHGSELVGSVHGLLCLSGYNGFDLRRKIVIWNPLVRKYINLPQSMGASMTANAGYTVPPYSILGFGYHGTMNDYRVVKITHFNGSESTPVVEVYSVNEREWRMISADYRLGKYIWTVSSSHCFLNGIIHWQAYRREEDAHDKVRVCLLLFNVEEENFKNMELPETHVNIDDGNRGQQLCVFEYQNKLSISICKYVNFDPFTTSCQIWVQKEYNVGSSWCKVLCVKLEKIMYLDTVCYLGRNGKLFGFVTENSMEPVLYDPKIGQIKGLGLGEHLVHGFSGTYKESLALLDQKTD